MAFCDFCPCEQCKTGEAVIEVFHAQTIDGRWICDICWHYSACLSAPAFLEGNALTNACRKLALAVDRFSNDYDHNSEREYEWAAGHDNTESEVEAETARFAGRLESIVLAWRARVEDALRLRAERRDVAQNVFSHLLGSYQDASRLRPADIEARARLALQAATVFQEVASKEPAP